MFPTDIGSCWEIYAGDLAVLTLEFNDEDGVHVDVSGYEDWRCQWRRRVGDLSAVEVTVDASAAADGVVQLILSPEQTRLVSEGVFDVQVSYEGDPHTLIRGETRWMEDVTR